MKTRFTFLLSFVVFSTLNLSLATKTFAVEMTENPTELSYPIDPSDAVAAVKIVAKNVFKDSSRLAVFIATGVAADQLAPLVGMPGYGATLSVGAAATVWGWREVFFSPFGEGAWSRMKISTVPAIIMGMGGCVAGCVVDVLTGAVGAGAWSSTIVTGAITAEYLRGLVMDAVGAKQMLSYNVVEDTAPSCDGSFKP